jgi:hypothetical protein
VIITPASPRIASGVDAGLDKIRWLLSEASAQPRGSRVSRLNANFDKSGS